MNQKKNRGASLIYVLIVLSIITIFSVNFIYFVNQRKDIVFIKNKGGTIISKNYLEKMEEKNAERLYNRGILDKGVPVLFKKKEDYFDSMIITDVHGNKEMIPLLYMNANERSIGEFHIKEIKDSDGNTLAFPLNKNTVYKNLEITYEKKVMEDTIFYREKLSIDRIDALTVEVGIQHSAFVK